MLYFNSQPHKEADNVLKWIEQTFQHFNSQPHKEADGVPTFALSVQENFNSQPHKEADLYRLNRVGITEISTHSLTRRLTVQC